MDNRYVLAATGAVLGIMNLGFNGNIQFSDERRFAVIGGDGQELAHGFIFPPSKLKPVEYCASVALNIGAGLVEDDKTEQFIVEEACHFYEHLLKLEDGETEKRWPEVSEYMVKLRELRVSV